ncbi:MAG TPA: D-alanyl-D-alanine carboxypeptidase/D-alanyl-D-alanine-endopeptidase [Actinomycetales bacterium]|nr:D-alanyl-D-alanine carboxypeptidase/D-alanyl-D-alanine-endopeptidase [Actinomycetales bacterium]
MKLARIIAPVLLLALAGGYVALDGADIVPGPLTTRPVISEPAPRPVLEVEVPPAAAVDYRRPSAVPNDISGVVAAFVASPDMGPRVALDIRDASTGERIASHNPTQLGPPASSTKVLTAAAALNRLGPTDTFATSVVLAPEAAGTAPDVGPEASAQQIVLVGGGDLLLGTGEPAAGVNGRASLTVLASQTATALAERGITTVSLGVDDTLFEGRGVDVWTELDYRYVINMTPLAISGGQEHASRVDYTIYTAETFAEELTAQGITVEGEPQRAPAPEGGALIGMVESAPVEEVTAWMLKTSSNSVAEALARHVAIARGEGNTAEAGAAAVTAEIRELGLPTTGLYLADTCGLAGENLISPELLVETVQLALGGTNPRLNPLVEGFPIAYLDGTLADRLHAVPGEIRAKTGTLTTVVSLTGIVEARSGARLTFSVVAGGLDPTGVESGVWGARLGVDRFVAALAENA